MQIAVMQESSVYNKTMIKWDLLKANYNDCTLTQALHKGTLFGSARGL